MKPEDSAIPQRPEITPERRKSLSLKTKLEIISRDPYCKVCGTRLGELSEVDFDHDIPLELGGADDPSNLRGLHRNCHRVKTADDQKAIAKARRLRKTRLGEAKGSRRKIPSRPFPKRKKNDRTQKSHDRRGEGNAEPEEGG